MLRVREDLWSTICLKVSVETGRDNVHLDTARTAHERDTRTVAFFRNPYVRVMGTPFPVPQITSS